MINNFGFENIQISQFMMMNLMTDKGKKKRKWEPTVCLELKQDGHLQ